MRRPRRLLLPALALPVALAGIGACAPFHAGAAATVGSTRIDTDRLRTATDAVLSRQPATGTTNAAQDAVQRDVLGSLVQLEVLQGMAARSRVTVTDVEVGQARTTLIGEILASAQTSGTLTPPQQATRAQSVAAAVGVDLDSLARVEAYVQAVSDALPVSADAVSAAFQAGGDHRYYDVDVVQVSDQSTAQAVASALTAAPAAIDRIRASLGSTAVTSTQVAAAQVEQQTGGPAKVGQVIGPIQASQTTYEVVLVTAAGTRTVTEALAAGSTERQALEARLFPAAYAAEARSLGVHVNPRFGAWSPTGQDALGEQLGAVTAGGTELSTPLVASSSAAATSGSADGSGSTSGS